MPILDPSLQFFLIQKTSSMFGERKSDFFFHYLKLASKYLGKNSETIEASIQFKEDLKNSIPFLNKKYNKDFTIEKMFSNPTRINYYQYLYNQLKSENAERLETGSNFFYKDLFEIHFHKPVVEFSENHSWFLTDSPIAILAVKLINFDNQDIITLINLEIDLMRASGYMLILCLMTDTSSKLTNDFILKVMKTHNFAEIHFNLTIDLNTNSDKNFYITQIYKNLLSAYTNFTGYFYLYQQFYENVSVELKQWQKILKKRPRFNYFSISSSFSDAFKLGKMDKYDLSISNGSSYCKSGFDQKKLRILLSNVLLYNLRTKKDLTPFEKSGFNVGYISKKDFLRWEKERVPILFYDCINENKFVEKYIKYEDIHFVRIDYYLKDTLYLAKADSQTLNYVKQIKKNSFQKFNDSKDEIFQKEKFNSFFKEKNLEKVIIYISSSYIHYMNNANTNRLSLFNLHENQIFTLLEACKLCYINKTKNKGIVYQIDTGEGKSCITRLIAAVLALLNKTVHITTSNIYLSNRDYYESFEFFKKVGLKPAVLLHYNELPYVNSSKKMNDYNAYNKDYFPPEFFDEKLFENSSNMNFSVSGINSNNEITKNKANIIFSTFINFESLYLMMMEMCPSYIDSYFNESYLIIDEADSILIDEIANGTILSRPMKTNCEEVLTYVYKRKQNGKSYQKVYERIKKKWPKCQDIEIDDVKEMYNEIDLISTDEFINGKKYSIEKGKNKIDDAQNKIKGNSKHKSKKSKSNETEYKEIVPFDYDHKGILEPNKEFSGFIHQFIAIKEKKLSKENRNMIIKDVSMNYLYVSHPIFANLYNGIIGLTGTIGNKYDKKILNDYYHLSTMKIPRNMPNGRIEYPLILCSSEYDKNFQIVNEVLLFHKKDYPVLVIFQNLNDIYSVLKSLLQKGIKYVNIFDGKNENIKPDKIAGRKGEISLGTNSCGRGTDIKNPYLPLHVIVAYYTPNTRVIQQAFGRTARQGESGSVRIICLESEYFSPTSILNDDSIKNILGSFSVKNLLQAQFIEEFRKNREWIFDRNIKSQKINNEFIHQMRETKININRIRAVNYVYPVCISIPTFLKIQAQKIFSLFNCPNCKYTWMLFQKYVREMILESWSLFINNSERKYHHSYSKLTYENYLKSELNEMKKVLNIYLPRSKNDDCGIIPTFKHIYNIVLQMYEKKIINSFPTKLMGCHNFGGKDRFCSFSIGFKPYSLVDKSGARINTLDDPEQEMNFIDDPELKYMRKQPKGFHPIAVSITERIDDIFNLICRKINEVIGSYLGLKFFIRRTLGGCEFGVCVDFDIHNVDKNVQNDEICIVDKDPLLLFTISVKSMIPILAGILIIGLIYITSVSKSILEWVCNFPTKFTTTVVKKTVKIVLENLASQLLDDKIDEFCGKIYQFLGNILQKQIDLLSESLPDIAALFSILMNIAISKDFSKSGDEINNLFTNQSFFKFNENLGMSMISNHLPFKHFLKLGLLIMLCFASFMMNFHIRAKALKYHTSNVAAQYDKTQQINQCIQSNEKYVKKEINGAAYKI